ncbi:MAG: hypothetical protein AAF541_18895 [Pseudomonadota bacterium]
MTVWIGLSQNLDKNVDNMKSERRENIRVTTHLPYKWAYFQEFPNLEQLTMSLLGREDLVPTLPHLERLRQEFQRHLQDVQDTPTRHALAVLGKQVQCLSDTILSADLSNAMEIELSADYIKLCALPDSNKHTSGDDDAQNDRRFVGCSIKLPDASMLLLRGCAEATDQTNQMLVRLEQTPKEDQVRLMRLIYSLTKTTTSDDARVA